MNDIDPIQFGKLLQAVKSIEARLDKMEPQINELLAVKNKGKGAFAAMILFSSLIFAGIIELIRDMLK